MLDGCLSNIKMLSLYPEIDILVSKLRFRDFCQSFKGFGTENLVSEKSFGFVKFGLKKVSVLEKLVPGSVSENLVSEKTFSFRKFGLEKSLGFGFGKLDIGIPEAKKKEENILIRRISFFWRRKYLEKISSKIVKDIEKSRFRSLSRDFLTIFEGYWFWRIWSRK